MSYAMFNLQFDPKEIPSLAQQYLSTRNGAEKDAKMERAGKEILAGRRTFENLEIIYKWKSPRFFGLLSKNTSSDIDRWLLRSVEAIKSGDDRSAVTALVHVRSTVDAPRLGLRGVQVPVASAILTAIEPKRFTVIDYKALASLGCPQEAPGVGFYLAYLEACRRIAEENKTCLRTLDRALWQWWTNREKG